jgi:hypothetical protein
MFRLIGVFKTFDMPKKQTLLQFLSLQGLWQFAQTLQATNMEINTREKTLLCECSEAERVCLPEYGGKVMEARLAHTRTQTTTNQEW